MAKSELKQMDFNHAQKLLFELKEVFDNLDIPFFLNYGTCLSAYRGGFVDGDLDVDLGVFHEIIVPKMEPLKQELARRGFKMMIHSKPFIYERALKAVKYGINVDLIDYALNERTNERFHNHYLLDYAAVHPASWFDDLKTINFLGKDFLMPNPPEKFLASMYGSKWQIPVSIFDDYRHLVGEYWRTTKFAKPTIMYYKRAAAAWEAYRLEVGEIKIKPE